MRTWLRVHHAGRVALALVTTAGLVAAAGEVTVPVPALPAGVPLALVLPLGASAVLVRGAYAGPASQEALAVRPAGALRDGMVAAVCLLALLAALAAAGAVPYALAAARNLAGFTGLAVLAARWRRDAATAVPAAYLVGAALLGGGEGAVWCWPVASASSPGAWVVPVAALVLGLAWRSPGPGGRLSSARGNP
ncbi:hypothetical protein Skr01_13090 [Sphaerisporangium krabiense]|uniref:Uncharacterized protein n=1 Tax=Sphaerisporangium krabiense TaxID=763782 RepID=A0A7W9DUL5_9ACTN|nr:hypothetical protein [Sphaerisporangium krabiense]MBB5631164.1 hypothetical protein [Sphaerisporangium krabiense]GII61224.1 hypothetical protein Skr01_13090 [Sphaerisporangium krabiense]